MSFFSPFQNYSIKQFEKIISKGKKKKKRKKKKKQTNKKLLCKIE